MPSSSWHSPCTRHRHCEGPDTVLTGDLRLWQGEHEAAQGEDGRVNGEPGEARTQGCVGAADLAVLRCLDIGQDSEDVGLIPGGLRTEAGGEMVRNIE